MHLYRSRHAHMRGLVISFFAFAALALLFVGALTRMGDQTQQEQEALIQGAVRRALVTCYAVEGQYPKDVDYLIAHYGLVVDTENYFITYDAFASNIMPDVGVLRKGTGNR